MPPILTRSRAILIGIVVLIAVPMLVPLITLRAAKARILQTLQEELGRRVMADTVRLQLLPLPGVELDNVRLADSPAFGAEDMAVAADATVEIRFLPLLRGRLDFSRVHLDEATINLVRNRQGRWNVAALLDHAGRTINAGRPGAAGTTRAFPYVDWSDARLNFKFHQTKTRFYLDQVDGSLARDNAGWHLHATFVPERSDLNLSDTGEVTLDGRWPDVPSAGHFGQRPFAMELRLSNSYLAGSSALVFGHDAVNGILSGQVHIQSLPPSPAAPEGFSIEGTIQAQSLRRWDLPPPQTTIGGEFRGIYTPSDDQFQLVQATITPGGQVQLQGEVQGLFSHSSGSLKLSLGQLPVSELIPLVKAVQSGMAQDLQAAGQAGGDAQISWVQSGSGATSWRANASLSLSHFQLSSGPDALQLMSAGLVFKNGQLRILPSQLLLRDGHRAATLNLSAKANHQAFAITVASDDWDPALSAALKRVTGLTVPWPPDLAGTARLDLALNGRWSNATNAAWSGQADMAQALFQPPQGPALRLSDVGIRFDATAPPEIQFTLSHPLTLSGRVRLGHGTSLPEFHLAAGHLSAVAVRRQFRVREASFVERVLAAITGSSSVSWLAGIRSTGTVNVADFNLLGVHSAVRMDLNTSPNQWTAPQLRVKIADGLIRGHGRLAHGVILVSGSVSPADSIRVAELLATTPFRGLLSGRIAGSLDVKMPVVGMAALDVEASGSFALTRGYLATGRGVAAFHRLTGDYELNRGKMVLRHVVWIEGDRRWLGQGTATLTQPAQYRIRLQNGTRRRTLTGPLRILP